MESLDSTDTELSLTDIYNKLLAHGELILTIPIDQEQDLRKGLTWTKAKQNKRIKEAGLQPDNASLSFTILPSTGKPELIDIHVVLAKKSSITIVDIKLPDPEL